jgi:cytosine/adenosine deaminase-related metal-dependent hydrolase
VSKLADPTVLRLDSVRLAGSRIEDLFEAVVFAAAPADVSQVMVGGRWIVRDGAHVSLDVLRELAAAIPR